MEKNSLVGLLLFLVVLMSGCRIYSLRGGDTSGAATFSVSYLKPRTPQASQIYTQELTNELKDFISSQSPLDVISDNGDLQFSGFVSSYSVAPASVGQGDIAALNKLTVSVKIKYVNTMEPEKSFDKTFTKFATFSSNEDIFAVEVRLWEDINEQLIQTIYNESLGNW